MDTINFTTQQFKDVQEIANLKVENTALYIKNSDLTVENSNLKLVNNGLRRDNTDLKVKISYLQGKLECYRDMSESLKLNINQ